MLAVVASESKRHVLMDKFMQAPDRRNSDSMKWQRYRQRDVIPMWVADMDFQAPQPVIDAMAARVAHGVFGYAGPSAALEEAVCAHLANEYGWRIDVSWLVWLPGLVSGLNIACRAIGEPGSGLLTATPIYPPFLRAPQLAGRRLVDVPLTSEGEMGDGRWQWDWPAMQVASHSPLSGFLLCHPHNPVGRAWSQPELEKVAEFCIANDLVLVSDEIHCDLLLNGQRHQPAAMLSPELARRTITLMAPSKTFNVPGLGCAFAVIPDAGLRRRFKAVMDGIVPHVNILGYVAAEAAYRAGGEWRGHLLDLLRSNRDRVQEAVAAMPGLHMNAVEATYLAWIDTRALGWSDPQRRFEEAGVGLSDGREFGAAGFVRLNFGCAPALLATALSRMASAVAVADAAMDKARP